MSCSSPPLQSAQNAHPVEVVHHGSQPSEPSEQLPRHQHLLSSFRWSPVQLPSAEHISPSWQPYTSCSAFMQSGSTTPQPQSQPSRLSYHSALHSHPSGTPLFNSTSG